MNFPILAIILGPHQLKKVFGSAKIIKTVNNLLNDERYVFTVEMTGNEITEMIKQLEAEGLSQILIENNIATKDESANILHQIELLGGVRNSEGNLTRIGKELLVSCFVVTLTFVSLIACGIYYYNARALNVATHSNIAVTFTKLIDAFRDVRTDGHLEETENHE